MYCCYAYVGGDPINLTDRTGLTHSEYGIAAPSATSAAPKEAAQAAGLAAHGLRSAHCKTRPASSASRGASDRGGEFTGSSLVDGATQTADFARCRLAPCQPTRAGHVRESPFSDTEPARRRKPRVAMTSRRLTVSGSKGSPRVGGGRRRTDRGDDEPLAFLSAGPHACAFLLLALTPMVISARLFQD